MKNVAFVVVALGILLATAIPSLAGDSWGGHDGHRAPAHHPGYSAVPRPVCGQVFHTENTCGEGSLAN